MDLLTEPFEVYLLYCSLKGHFKGKNDYFKHKRLSKIKHETFQKRKDRFFFHKISKKYSLQDCELFLAVNFAYNNNFWIGSFDDRETNEIYSQHIKIKYAFEYYLESDIRYLEENGGFIESLKIKEHPYPPAIYHLKGGQISFETLTYLYNILNLKKYWKIKDTIYYPNLETKLNKFYPFLGISMKKEDAIEHIRKLYKKIKEG